MEKRIVLVCILRSA